MSRFDVLFRSMLVTKMFTKGWGKPEELKRIFTFRKQLSDRDVCQHFVPKDYPVYIDKEVFKDGVRILEGHFLSPLVGVVPGILPKESEIARFQIILPPDWKTELKPVCVHLGGTGDHFFRRRRNLMARPLLKEHGIASVILENPYYGYRKPKKQLRSSLHYVSDLFVMGGALILECMVLFNWCDRMGYGPLGVTGISMGGFMSSLAATNWNRPLSLVPCLSWSTASSVYTKGVMSKVIPWKLLQHQYYTDTVYETEVRHMIESPEPYWKSSSYKQGVDFAKSYSETISELQTAEESCDVKNNVGDVVSDTVISEFQAGSEKGSGQSASTGVGASCHGNTNNSMETSSKLTGNQTSTDSHGNLTGSSANQNSSSDTSVTGKVDSGSQKRHFATRPVNTMSAEKLKQWRGKAKKPSTDSGALNEAVMDFMRGAMDECTHLGNFSVPVDPELIIIVAAKHDMYIPRGDVLSLEKLWPGSEVRYIDGGHIMAFLTQRDVFRQAIADSFQKQIDKYYSSS